jgi:hypothetical protein
VSLPPDPAHGEAFGRLFCAEAVQPGANVGGEKISRAPEGF